MTLSEFCQHVLDNDGRWPKVVYEGERLGRIQGISDAFVTVRWHDNRYSHFTWVFEGGRWDIRKLQMI